MKYISEFPANPDGLHQRYKVSKVTGEPADPNATYFVLRLDGGGDDLRHVLACRTAARAWASHILSMDSAVHLHKTARELVGLVNALERLSDG